MLQEELIKEVKKNFPQLVELLSPFFQVEKTEDIQGEQYKKQNQYLISEVNRLEKEKSFFLTTNDLLEEQIKYLEMEIERNEREKNILNQTIFNFEQEIVDLQEEIRNLTKQPLEKTVEKQLIEQQKTIYSLCMQIRSLSQSYMYVVRDMGMLSGDAIHDTDRSFYNFEKQLNILTKMAGMDRNEILNQEEIAGL